MGELLIADPAFKIIESVPDLAPFFSLIQYLKMFPVQKLGNHFAGVVCNGTNWDNTKVANTVLHGLDLQELINFFL